LGKHEHIHRADGAESCLITKDEAAGLAGVTTRTIDNWAGAGRLTKHTQNASGYWVRFCRHEVRDAAAWTETGELRAITEGAGVSTIRE
jgi:hypothetical protein